MEAWHLATLALIRATGGQTYEQWKAKPDAARDKRIQANVAKFAE